MDHSINKKHFGLLSVTIIVAIAICIIPVIVYIFVFHCIAKFNFSIDVDTWSGFSTYYSGIVGPLLTFISVILIIKTLSTQKAQSLADNKKWRSEQFSNWFFLSLSIKQNVLENVTGKDFFNDDRFNELRGSEFIILANKWFIEEFYSWYTKNKPDILSALHGETNSELKSKYFVIYGSYWSIENRLHSYITYILLFYKKMKDEKENQMFEFYLSLYFNSLSTGDCDCIKYFGKRAFEEVDVDPIEYCNIAIEHKVQIIQFKEWNDRIEEYFKEK